MELNGNLIVKLQNHLKKSVNLYSSHALHRRGLNNTENIFGWPMHLTTYLMHSHISTLTLNRSQWSLLIFIYRIFPRKTLLTFLPDDNQCGRLCVVWQVINYLSSLNKQPQVQASPSILWVRYLLTRARVFVARGYIKFHIKDSKSWCNQAETSPLITHTAFRSSIKKWKHQLDIFFLWLHTSP